MEVRVRERARVAISLLSSTSAIRFLSSPHFCLNLCSGKLVWLKKCEKRRSEAREKAEAGVGLHMGATYLLFRRPDP